MATEHSDTTTEQRSSAFVPFFGRFFPESLALSILLALVALLVTIPSLDALTQLELFATGFYDLFSVQMTLILFWVLSAAVVESRAIGGLFDRVAAPIPTSQTAIIYATGFIALLFGWINWAFGLIGGLLVGQALCRRASAEGVSVHYPLVLTAGLLSLVLTNQGLSSPGALMMADPTGVANFLVDSAGTIAFSAFVLDPANLVSSLVLLVTLPLVLVVLAPDEGDRTELDEVNTILGTTIADTLDHHSVPADEEHTVADRLEQSWPISAVAGVLGLGSVALYVADGGGLTLPWLLFVLVAVGLLVQVRPMAFRSKTTETVQWANHVAIPFLLYAVVFALLSEAGLYEPIGSALDAIGATAVGGFVAAFGLGLLVPDPGSVWVMLGPGLVETDLDLVRSIVVAMYGAGLSNLWLGFLFAGILSISGFDWREFVRYAAIVTVYVAVVVVVLVLVL